MPNHKEELKGLDTLMNICEFKKGEEGAIFPENSVKSVGLTMGAQG